ncbi:MAG TPA: hypothetical protein VN668_18915, partial [Stellaceae bacterium]|nr:hypothetical protein [Stellaceae bacterium]
MECNTLQQPFLESLKRPKRRQMLDFFASPLGWRDPDWLRVSKIRLQPDYRSALGGVRNRAGSWKVMGIVMKKMVLLATALAMVSGSALAADMPVKAMKAPPPPAFEPWDIAFGSALMSDYVFRGITQSNHKPSVAAYFEPRYNINKD